MSPELLAACKNNLTSAKRYCNGPNEEFFLSRNLLWIVVTVEHEITLEILKFIFNLIEKVKPGFLFSSVCMFPEKNGTKS